MGMVSLFGQVLIIWANLRLMMKVGHPSSYFGINDLAGLPKDRFYLYRSRWNTKESTLHILPHWNWKVVKGKQLLFFVHKFQQCRTFINGKSMEFRKKKTKPQNRYRLMWMDVKYEPGTVKVVAFDDNGKAVAEQKYVLQANLIKLF
jgi:beta-galactosidase